MTAPALIVMAGGIGNRYGGLKQVEPVGPSGEILMDYSIYDAIRAGFGKVIFLIRHEIEDIFRERVGRAVEKLVETTYVFQELSDLPPGFSLPTGRTRPWGTGHAVLSCKRAIDGPFGVINADDFYGSAAFTLLAGHLRAAQDRDGVSDYCMVGYTLNNTLSEHGSVARGVCQMSPEGYLAGIVERTRIERSDAGVRYSPDGEQWLPLPADSTVSMNMFGFTPGFMQELEGRFPHFLQTISDPLKSEFFLPNTIDELLSAGQARVKVLKTPERWFGVTNPGDLPIVQSAIRRLVASGVYPAKLWG
ncbi:MAG TPA: sugar phosphate nucleotidyltransferase [Levilinea sp.]|nr:sugar phosphate nucleotidyltransferase [Levilinea sp.]